MLEGALEKLLLRFLEPYVEGIAKDKLHLGVFSGSLELKSLRLKPEVLALLGFPDFRARSSTIGLISISVPWKALYSKEICVTVNTVHVEVEHSAASSSSDTEVLAEMRASKGKVVELRTQQLSDLLMQQEEEGASKEEEGGPAKPEGFTVRLVRKVVENLRVTFSDMEFSMVSKAQGLACSAQLPGLAVLSADENFRTDLTATDSGAASGSSLFKMLRLQKLGLKMAEAGNSDLSTAQYILTPISIDLNMAHVPSEQRLHFRLEVAAKERVAFRMLRSQSKHLLRIMAQNAAEKERLRLLCVPADVESSVLGKDGGAAAQETYAALYRRKLLQERSLAEDAAPLAGSDLEQFNLLEDVLPVLFLARQRLKVLKEVDALEQVIQKKKLERKKEEKASKPGMFARLMGRSAPAAAGAAAPNAPLMTEEEREQALQVIRDKSKVPDVELPQRYKLELVLGTTAVDLIDDRWQTDADRQLLSAALQGARIGVDVVMKPDHRGNDSVEWTIEFKLDPFHARQNSKELISLLRPKGDALSNDPSTRSFDSGSFVARLLVANQLEPNRNLLRLEFATMPLELHWLPGFYEPILEFVQSPEAQLPRSKSMHLETKDAVRDLSQQLLEVWAEQAKETAVAVYQRLPDALSLDVAIASPIFHVPVEGEGTSTISLGRVKLQTPQPCEYNRIGLEIDLTDTMVSATSAKGERFDMIQPLAVHIGVTYSNSAGGEATVDVQVGVEEVKLTLAPQACRILLALPLAFATASRTAAGPGDALEVAQKKQTEGAAEKASKLMEAAEEFAGSHTALSEALAAAKDQVAQVRSRTLRVEVCAVAKRLEMTLSDSIKPVLRVHTDLLGSGIVAEYCSQPKKITAGLERASIEVELLNPRHGCWEPLLEGFEFSVGFSQQVEDAVQKQRVVISGYSPLLLNVTPTAVRTATWFLPFFLEGFRAPVAPGAEVQGGQTPSMRMARQGAREPKQQESLEPLLEEARLQGAKYRVVNICQEPLVLTFTSRHKRDLVMTVAPTGSSWKSLDDMILPNFAESLSVSLEGGEPSLPLALDRGTGAVKVPGLGGAGGLSGAFAELMTPHPSYRVLLLSGPLRVHNRTDLPLVLRFHDKEGRGLYRVIAGVLAPTAVCDAALFGHKPPSCAAKSAFSDQPPSDTSDGLLLPPNSVCAVPPAALHVEGRQPGEAKFQGAWMSVRPAVANSKFCLPFLGGVDVGGDPRVLECGNGVDGEPCLTVSVAGYESCPPARTLMTTVVLQPMLTLINAIPIGELGVGLVAEGRGGAAWQDVAVPSMAMLNVYRLPAGVVLNVRARLGPAAPWSEPAKLSRASLWWQVSTDSPGSYSQELELAATADGAPAGLSIVAAGRGALRVECPSWFADRSGIKDPDRLRLYHRGKALPWENGITLLPAKCLEEDCDLYFVQNDRGTSSQKIRAPAGWSSFTWNTPIGPRVLCMQADQVAPAEVLGAQSQVITLRARLVLTNTADCTVSVRRAGDTAAGQEVHLETGKSTEWHWPPSKGSGGEDDSKTTLSFRPEARRAAVGDAPQPWSEPIVCGDATVGSHALALLTPGRGAEVWSVDVATSRGALAVSFRRGSDFVAVNRCTRAKVAMVVCPAKPNRQYPDRDIEKLAVTVHPGDELPYGWVQPGQKRAATVRLQPMGQGRVMQLALEDVQTTTRIVVPDLSVVLSVTRSGDRVLLLLEDGGTPSSSSTTPQAAAGANAETQTKGAQIVLEVKLPRCALSLVQELPLPRELMYMKLELIRVEFIQTESDLQLLQAAISEVQVDCHQPGRVDGNTRNKQKEDGQSLGLVKKDAAAVLLANCAAGSLNFLTLKVQRVSTSSRDFLLPSISIELDALDVTVDDEWVGALREFASQATNMAGVDQARAAGEGGGVLLAHIRRTAGKTILEGYQVPPLPSVIQLDKLHISGVELTVWCSIALRNLHFLPPALRAAIMILSLSGRVTLDGANLTLPPRDLPAHRGSVSEFVSGLASQYTMDVLRQVASLLGRSSLLNVPTVPLKFGGTTVTFIGDTLSVGVDEFSGLLEKLTFDKEYIERQKQIRAQKRISNLGDGLVEAGGALGHGMLGVTDVFTKPIEGAKEGGVGGFFLGIGQGVIGAVSKPVVGVASAFSSVTQGVSAQVHQITGTSTMQGRRNEARVRSRFPRLLYSSQGVIRPWSEFDAEVLRQVGQHQLRGGGLPVEAVLPLTNVGPTRKVLLLFPDRIMLSEIKYSGPGIPGGGSTGSFRYNPEVRAGERLLTQALRPINTITAVGDAVGGAIGLGGSTMVAEEMGDPEVAKKSQSFNLGGLREATLAGDVLQLQDPKGSIIPLELPAVPAAVRQALHEALQGMLKPPRKATADWGPLVGVLQAIRNEERAAATFLVATPTASGGSPGQSFAPGLGNSPGSTFSGAVASAASVAGGLRRLDVWEVESRFAPLGPWRTPFLPTDYEVSWRWMDASNCRHPHLRKDLKKEQVDKYKEPPCELEMYRPVNTWTLDTNRDTDKDGWMYALHWSAGTWNSRQGPFDAVRKRHWTRDYT